MMPKKSQNLTVKQKRVYDFITQYLAKNDLSPTIFELASFLGVSSLRTVTQYLESLEKKGFIVRSRFQSRGIKIVKDIDLPLTTVTLPVVSAAGCDNLNVFAEQSFDEYVTVDCSFLGGARADEIVVFRAFGDSMVDADIETGDLVLTQMTQEVRAKDKVVAIIDGKAVIKQISFTPNAVVLSPMSSDKQYHPIIMKKGFQVLGKVIEVIKNLGTEELAYESI